MVQGFIKNEDLLGPGPFLELEQAPAYVQEALQGLINSGTVKKPYVRALFRRAQEFRRINRHMYGVPMIDLVTDDEGSEPSVDGSVFDDQETAEQAAQDDWMQGAALEDILAQHPTPPVQLVAAPINPVHPAWAADEVVDLVSPPPSPLHTPAYNTVAAHASTAALLMQLGDPTPVGSTPTSPLRPMADLDEEETYQDPDPVVPVVLTQYDTDWESVRPLKRTRRVYKSG